MPLRPWAWRTIWKMTMSKSTRKWVTVGRAGRNCWVTSSASKKTPMNNISKKSCRIGLTKSVKRSALERRCRRTHQQRASGSRLAPTCSKTSTRMHQIWSIVINRYTRCSSAPVLLIKGEKESKFRKSRSFTKYVTLYSSFDDYKIIFKFKLIKRC